MDTRRQEQLNSQASLREIARQATVALIDLDGERLQELARYCVDLNLENQGVGSGVKSGDELMSVQLDLQLLGRVLHETRANLTVFSRLHWMRLREAGALAGEMNSYRFDMSDGLANFRLPMERKAEYGDN